MKSAHKENSRNPKQTRALVVDGIDPVETRATSASEQANVLGFVDILAANKVNGWAIDKHDPSKKMPVTVFLGDQELASTTASNYRSDLFDAGIGDGFGGFQILFPYCLDANQLSMVTVRCDGIALPHSAPPATVESTVDVSHVPRPGVAAPEVTEKWFFYPDYTSTNPYQSLAARSLPQSAAARPGTIDDAITELNDSERSSKVVFHLHWTTPIVAPAENEWAAERRVDEFVSKLRFFVGSRGTVIWTVHNVLSHDGKYRAAEERLCRIVSKLASRIHVHSRVVLDAVRTSYQIAQHKVVEIPHPNYIGVYPNYVDPVTARNRFGIAESTRVFAFIGQLRPYKGIRELLDAFRRLKASVPDVHLIIAGKPVAPYRVGTIEEMCAGIEGVSVSERHIPDSELQWIFNAADFVVLPYLNVLTSGSVLNALSFSRPVIAPALGLLPEVISHNTNGFLYDPAIDDALFDEMKRAVKVTKPKLISLKKAALRSVAAETWEKFGAKLHESVQETLSHNVVAVHTEAAMRDVIASRFPGHRGPRSKIAVIILNYRNLSDSMRLIESLSKSNCQDFEIFLVDNASPEVTPADLADLAPDGIPFTWIQTTENLGYAAGNNVGLSFARGQDFDFYWILNPDMEVTPSTLDALLRAAREHSGVNVFGGAIGYGHDKNKIWFAGATLDMHHGLRTEHQFNGLEFKYLPTQPYSTDYITGASLFCRPAAFSLAGDIPEDYFLYFEETDWCLRLRQQGEKLLVVPDARMYHHKRSEEGGLPTHTYFYYYIRNTIIFAAKYCEANLRATEQVLQENFVQKWLAKISSAAPADHATFRTIAEMAIQDGRAGRVGVRNLLPLIAGLPQTDSVARCTVEVHIESWKDGAVRGWAFDFLRPDTRLRVALFIDGRHVSTIVANQYRKDIEEAGKGDGAYAFEFPIQTCLFDGKRHRLNLVIEACPPNLQMDVVACRPAEYVGRIDGLAGFSARGWAYNKFDHCEQVQVELVVNGEVIAIGKCDLSRADLAKHGIGNGSHGFEIRIPAKFASVTTDDMVLRLAGNGTVLARRTTEPSNLPPILPSGTLDKQLDWLFYHREFRSVMGEVGPALSYFADCEKALRARYASRSQSRLVSVIMPAFNRASTILSAIQSVVRQSYRNLELLIIDDGSSDSTVSVVEEFIRKSADSRVKLIRLESNIGVSAARNIGLLRARGDFIAYLDSDNDWNEDFLLIMCNSLEESDDRTSAYCGQSIWHLVRQEHGNLEEQILIRTGAFWLSLLENRNYIDLNCFVHRRILIETSGGFNENLRRLVDWELIWRFALEAAPLFVPVLLSRYFMDKADNQITKLEHFQNNLNALRASMLAHKNKILGTTAGSDEVDVLVKLEKDDSDTTCIDVALQTEPRAVRKLTVAIPQDTSAWDFESRFERHSQVEILKYTDESWSDVLRNVTEQAKETRGLIIMSPNARLERGSLAHLLKASEDDPSAAAVIGRMTAQGKQEKLIAFATAAHSIDVALHYAPPVLGTRAGAKNHTFEATKLPYFLSFIPATILNRFPLWSLGAATMKELHEKIRNQITWSGDLRMIYTGLADNRMVGKVDN